MSNKTEDLTALKDFLIALQLDKIRPNLSRIKNVWDTSIFSLKLAKKSSPRKFLQTHN